MSMPPTAEIALTKGFVALVDADDAAMLRQFSWAVKLRQDGLPSGAATSLYRPKRCVRMHQMILSIAPGEVPAGLQVDHVNGNPLDNRRSNLRLCTLAQNMQNRRGWGQYGKGVKLLNGRFQARIQAFGRTFYLGTFANLEDARAAYEAASLQHHGAFASSRGSAADLHSQHMGAVNR